MYSWYMTEGEIIPAKKEQTEYLKASNCHAIQKRTTTTISLSKPSFTRIQTM